MFMGLNTIGRMGEEQELSMLVSLQEKKLEAMVCTPYPYPVCFPVGLSNLLAKGWYMGRYMGEETGSLFACRLVCNGNEAHYIKPVPR